MTTKVMTMRTWLRRRAARRARDRRIVEAFRGLAEEQRHNRDVWVRLNVEVAKQRHG